MRAAVHISSCVADVEPVKLNRTQAWTIRFATFSSHTISWKSGRHGSACAKSLRGVATGLGAADDHRPEAHSVVRVKDATGGEQSAAFRRASIPGPLRLPGMAHRLPAATPEGATPPQGGHWGIATDSLPA